MSLFEKRECTTVSLASNVLRMATAATLVVGTVLNCHGTKDTLLETYR
jgi:16S rRNA U1498 N3-methylase RsmE